MKVQQNYSLKSYNTFGINAFASYFIEVNSVDEIREAIKFAKENNLNILLLNGGSNILFTQDFEGVVIKINLKGKEIIQETTEEVWVKVQAGENWHEFVQWTLQQDFGGLENLSLIPGNCGTSPMQNIGAYGVEIKDVMTELHALEIASGEIKNFTNEQCKFGYRESIFKNEVKNQYILLNVTYKLSKTNHKFHIHYGAIQSELAQMKADPITIQAISQAVINIRQSKLPDPTITGNAGSFFKNPVIEKSHFENLKVKFPEISGYETDGKVKIAAGWLIEQAGWKGFRKGDAGVHSKQALVLVNYGNATGKEIFELSTHIIEDIYRKFQIILEREVNII